MQSSSLVPSNYIESFKNTDNNILKDLVICSLIDYICMIHNTEKKTYKQICKELNKFNILNNSDTSGKKFIKKRKEWASLIDNFFKNYKQPKLTLSRYEQDFIEIKKLGTGGFGKVYQAKNIHDNNIYAIKIVDIEKQYEFHRNECETFSKLNHPNIVRYYASWYDMNDNKLYIQMELCDTTLANYLERRNYSGINNDYKREQKIFNDIYSALKYLHDMGIIHNDLNPNNIFLDSNMNVKIGDFGLSCNNHKNNILCDDESFGVELYQDGNGGKSFGDDYYSLAIIYIELFCKFNTLMEKYTIINKIKKYFMNKNDNYDNNDQDILNVIEHINLYGNFKVFEKLINKNCV